MVKLVLVYAGCCVFNSLHPEAIMDIIKPFLVNFNRFGGKSASSWDDCYAGKGLEVYESQVVPYVRGRIEPMFNIVEHVERMPNSSAQRPVTYVVGGSPKDWEVAEATIKESWKTPGTKKEFEASRRAGNIVLKPMLNCKLFGTATPRIIPGDTPYVSYMRYHYSKIGGIPRGGVCRRNELAFPDIRCDSYAESVSVDRMRFENASTIPVGETELRRVMRLVQNRLDSIPPDRSLVTQVVSEANSATWDIATEIGEMPETIKYILNGLKQGILLLLRAKREIKQQLSQGAVTDTASIWMQYRYALSPIIYSVNDALDVLGMDAVKFQSFRGRKDSPLFETTELGGYTVKSAPNYNNRVFLKYKYDVDSSIHHGLKINLAATAWELLPLSFVFDWFFQVGDYLTAAFRPGVVSGYGCQQSVKCSGALVLEGNFSETIKIDIDYYRCRIINPNAFIGVNSDVFISFKRTMDALALSWLLFKKTSRRG